MTIRYELTTRGLDFISQARHLDPSTPTEERMDNLKDLISSLEAAIDHYAVMESDVAVMQETHGKVSGHVKARTQKARERVTSLIDRVVDAAEGVAV